MLGQLSSGDFSRFLGQRCLLQCGDVVIETVLDSVSDNPLAAHPFAPAGSRIPFTLLFRGAPDSPWNDGVFTLRVEGMAEIPGVYVNRILNVGPTPGSLFQAVFN
jgi:hypothetical protein